MKFLILQPELDQSVSIARMLKKHVAGADVAGGFFKGQLRKKQVQKAAWFDRYIELGTLIEKDFDDYDVIIPTGAESTELVGYKKKKFKLGEVTFSSSNFIVSDKLKMYQLSKIEKIPHPETYLSEDEIPSYPVFFKNLHENSGKVRGVARSRKDLEKIKSRTGLMYQEYIGGHSTYGVAFIAQDGKISCSLIYEEMLSFPKSGGSAALLSKMEDGRLFELTSRLVQKIDYTGWGLAEFKFCRKRNDYVFMEINSKFWSSIEFAMMCEPAFAQKLFGIKLPKSKSRMVSFPHRIAGLFLHEYFGFLGKIIRSEMIIITKRRVLYYFFSKFFRR